MTDRPPPGTADDPTPAETNAGDMTAGAPVDAADGGGRGQPATADTTGEDHAPSDAQATSEDRAADETTSGPHALDGLPTERFADRVDAFIALLEAHRGERHVVVLHDFPDPDAIAAAYAQRIISAAFDIEADLVHGGRISHQQNIALVKLLEIDLRRYDADDGLDLGTYDGAVFVDHQGTNVGELVDALEAAEVPVLAIVDHHEPQERVTPRVRDVRKVGATATIYADYLAHLEARGRLVLDHERVEHVRLATALMMGLMTDTRDFIDARPADFEAACYLSAYSDRELLRRVVSQARSKQTMDVIDAALSNRVIVDNYSIAGIGYVRRADRDAIPQAADFLLSEENVHTAIVYGIVRGDGDGEERVIGSLRTNKLTLDPDRFIKDVFGRARTGRYFGGGKMMAGGFEIPLGFLSGGEGGESFSDLKWQVYDTQIKQRLFAKLDVEPPERDEGEA